MTLINFFSKLFKQKNFKLETFTYFIPAPPSRSTGYREKQFDKLVSKMTSFGVEIEDIKTESINKVEGSGMWIIFLLRVPRQINLNRLIDSDPNTQEGEVPGQSDDKDKVEGLYYID